MSSHDCHRDATCMNMIGSFECRCNAGFTGDGRNCQSMDAELIKAMTNLHPTQIPETIVFLTCIVMQEASDALSKLQTVTLFRPIRSLQRSFFFNQIYVFIYHLTRIGNSATLYRQP